MPSLDCSHLGELPRALAARYRDRNAAVSAQREVSFHELDRGANLWSRALRECGCRRGTAIGLLAPNSPEWLTVAFGIWRCGATLVPISTFATPRELEEILAHAGVEVLVIARRLRSRDLLGMLDEIHLPQLRRILVLDDGLPALNAPSAALPATDTEDIACILYTSGTTGRPKGVRLSHRAILATIFPTAERTGLGQDDSLLTTLPLFWVAGLIIRALPTLVAGCELVLVDVYSAESVLEMLSQRRPTALHLRPPQVADLLAHSQFRPELLHPVRRGNGRREWFAGLLPAEARLITGYGMTEMAGYVTALDWREAEEVQEWDMGAPLPGVEIRIIDDDQRPCRAGETGHVRVRGPGLFSGYHTETPGSGLDAEGWLVTGDLGSIDARGRFRFAGRTKDLLRVKGINVSPVEVEQVLGTHPGVEAAYVVGLPAAGLDQQVVAMIVAASGASEEPLRESLGAWAARQLSPYKRPQAYLFLRREEVPLGATSKPQKEQLALIAAQRLATSAGRTVAVEKEPLRSPRS